MWGGLLCGLISHILFCDYFNEDFVGGIESESCPFHGEMYVGVWISLWVGTVGLHMGINWPNNRQASIPPMPLRHGQMVRADDPSGGFYRRCHSRGRKKNEAKWQLTSFSLHELTKRTQNQGTRQIYVVRSGVEMNILFRVSYGNHSMGMSSPFHDNNWLWTFEYRKWIHYWHPTEELIVWDGQSEVWSCDLSFLISSYLSSTSFSRERTPIIGDDTVNIALAVSHGQYR